MKWIFATACAAAISMATVSGADAKGCIKGAIVGGVAGHMAGHGKLGAAAGCVIGHHEATSSTAQRGPSLRLPWRRSTASSPPVCDSAVCLPIQGTAPAGLSARL
jgi:hypothetical protein